MSLVWRKMASSFRRCNFWSSVFPPKSNFFRVFEFKLFRINFNNCAFNTDEKSTYRAFKWAWYDKNWPRGSGDMIFWSFFCPQLGKPAQVFCLQLEKIPYGGELRVRPHSCSERAANDVFFSLKIGPMPKHVIHDVLWLSQNWASFLGIKILCRIIKPS